MSAARYIMVDLETNALKICLIQQMCNIPFLFHNGSTIKDKKSKNLMF
jgi:hypothetical protein